MESFTDNHGLISAVESLIGGRNENQDSYAMAQTNLGLLVAVCDGMGGGPAGKAASTIAAQAIIDYVSGAPANKNPMLVLKEAVISANENIRTAIAARPEYNGMGTTCACVLITYNNTAYFVHVGDSRCYQLRGNSIIFRTTDHSYVAELVKRGTLTEEEARNSPYSNVITRAIGVDVDVDPEVDVVEFRPGDRFALMSDGIWGTMPENELVKLLCHTSNPDQLVSAIATHVDTLGENKGGGHDNLTIAIVDVPKNFVPAENPAPRMQSTAEAVPTNTAIDDTPKAANTGAAPYRSPAVSPTATGQPGANAQPDSPQTRTGRNAYPSKANNERYYQPEKTKKRIPASLYAIAVILLILIISFILLNSRPTSAADSEPIAQPDNEIVNLHEEDEYADKSKTNPNEIVERINKSSDKKNDSQNQGQGAENTGTQNTNESETTPSAPKTNEDKNIVDKKEYKTTTTEEQAEGLNALLRAQKQLKDLYEYQPGRKHAYKENSTRLDANSIGGKRTEILRNMETAKKKCSINMKPRIEDLYQRMTKEKWTTLDTKESYPQKDCLDRIQNYILTISSIANL